MINGESEPIDIQIYDVEKCFDALWLDDCMLDLYETLLKILLSSEKLIYSLMSHCEAQIAHFGAA